MGWGRSDGTVAEAEPPPPSTKGESESVGVCCKMRLWDHGWSRSKKPESDSGRRSPSRQVLGAVAQGRLQWASGSAWLLSLPLGLSLGDSFVPTE